MQGTVVKQYVAYFTVGWNCAGQLVPIPVLAKYFKVDDRPDPVLKVDDMATTAKDRQSTILILDKEIFGLNAVGDGRGEDYWWIVGSTVRSADCINASKAVSRIKQIYKENGIKV